MINDKAFTCQFVNEIFFIIPKLFGYSIRIAWVVSPGLNIL